MLVKRTVLVPFLGRAIFKYCFESLVSTNRPIVPNSSGGGGLTMCKLLHGNFCASVPNMQ